MGVTIPVTLLFDKIVQIVFALFFELKDTIKTTTETTPISFNDLLDCVLNLQGIPRGFDVSRDL